MTSAVMLAAIRTILDEASASFWTDAESYAALADGQNEVIKELLNVYRAKRRIDPAITLPYELETVLEDDGAGMAASDVSLPAGFLELISAKWDHDASGTENPCYILDATPGLDFREGNSFLAATETNPIAYIMSVSGTKKINFRPVYDTNGTYSIRYIKTPTDIAAGQNPTLPVSTHSAIVNYAVARLFQKDDRPQEAQIYYARYLQEIKTLLIKE